MTKRLGYKKNFDQEVLRNCRTLIVDDNILQMKNFEINDIKLRKYKNISTNEKEELQAYLFDL